MMLGNLFSNLLSRDVVGGILALAFSSATIYLWTSGQPVPSDLLVINAVVVQNYVNTQNQKSVVAATAPAEPALAPPSVSDDDLSD